MIKSVIGDLDNVVRIVKLIGYINAEPGFQDAPAVLNGASDLLVEVFGPEQGKEPGFRDAPAVLNGASDLLVEVFGPEQGKHARAALYQHELTFDAPVEIEMTVQVKP
jgi:enamine deaminase RidA (YjgF/YER057c/UK114 family)